MTLLGTAGPMARTVTHLSSKCYNSTIKDYVFQLLAAAFQSNNQCFFNGFFRARA